MIPSCIILDADYSFNEENELILKPYSDILLSISKLREDAKNCINSVKSYTPNNLAETWQCLEIFLVNHLEYITLTIVIMVIFIIIKKIPAILNFFAQTKKNKKRNGSYHRHRSSSDDQQSYGS